MPQTPDDQLRHWVETWQRAGRELDALWQETMRHYQPEKHVQEVDDLLDLAVRFAQPRETSGLVEQQRRFQKARHLFRKEAE